MGFNATYLNFRGGNWIDGGPKRGSVCLFCVKSPGTGLVTFVTPGGNVSIPFLKKNKKLG